MDFSRYSSPLPDALLAEDRALLAARMSRVGESATSRPMPPPPALALTISGKPTSFPVSPSAASSTTNAAGSTGTPNRATNCRACHLSAIASVAESGGPTRTSPALSHARAKSAFSERKP